MPQFTFLTGIDMKSPGFTRQEGLPKQQNESLHIQAAPSRDE
jgi:hypothetical protein